MTDRPLNAIDTIQVIFEKNEGGIPYAVAEDWADDIWLNAERWLNKRGELTLTAGQRNYLRRVVRGLVLFQQDVEPDTKCIIGQSGWNSVFVGTLTMGADTPEITSEMDFARLKEDDNLFCYWNARFTEHGHAIVESKVACRPEPEGADQPQ